MTTPSWRIQLLVRDMDDKRFHREYFHVAASREDLAVARAIRKATSNFDFVKPKPTDIQAWG